MIIPHKPFGELSDAEKGALLLAEFDGAVIERRCGGAIGAPSWISKGSEKFYGTLIYRIAPEPIIPDSIDWQHVADEAVAAARCRGDSQSLLFSEIPKAGKNIWLGESIGVANLFASYRRGTVEWQDSLVIRPGYEGKP